MMKYRRICITRCGYAVVPGNTDEAAMDYAVQNLNEHDFDWEKVNADLIRDGEIIEVCNADGSVTQE